VIRVALRGLAGRKFRAVLTAIAIVLGVAMISGTLVLTDTIDRAFDRIFVQSYAGTDAVVTAASSDISFEGETATAPPFPESILERVRSVSSVEAATGSVFEETAVKILDRDGEPISGNAPTFGFGIDPAYPRFNPLELKDGRWATGPNEVVIDSGTAEDENYQVGDRVRVATLAPVQAFELTGIAQYPGVESLGGATFAIFDVATAQTLLNREGKLDSISAAATPGTSPDELVADLDDDLPNTVMVRTGVEQADEDSSEVAVFISFIRYFLLTFGAIALFVGAFVIFNTLSITVAQRTRELATLRTLGASRRQVLTSVLVEAFTIGAIASVIGLFLGVALAKGLNALFKALNLELPTTGLVFAPRTVIVALLVGILVTMVAALAPAWRATRVSPISAVREGAVPPPGRFSHFSPYIAAVLVALSVLLLAYSLFADGLGVAERLLSIAFGVLFLFFGVALLSPKLVRPIASVVGWPATKLGGAAGKLAQGNSKRNPGRTAATAASLMIGIALVTFVATLAAGMRDSNRQAIEDQIGADLIITSEDGYSPFAAGAGEAAGGASGVTTVTDVREEVGRAQGSGKNITGIDPDRITSGYNFKWAEGSSDAALSQMGQNGALIAEDFADDKKLAIGDTITVQAPGGNENEFVVRGIYDPPPFYPLLGAVSIPTTAFDQLFEQDRNRFTFVDVEGGPSETAKRSVEAATAAFPDARVQTRQEWIDKEDQEFQQFLSLLYVLLALSVIVSIFGIINTLVLSVFERTRELGMLRAVGMTRRQVRRMIRHESVITALIGTALGLPLGVFLAALMVRALSQFEVDFKVPTGQLILFAVVAIIVGIIAAVLPARRAARLNVLQALQYE
jgi:putative ABC transport system permease protein